MATAAAAAAVASKLHEKKRTEGDVLLISKRAKTSYSRCCLRTTSAFKLDICCATDSALVDETLFVWDRQSCTMATRSPMEVRLLL